MEQKILVLTDSHKRSQTIVDIIQLENPDCLIFCGDLLKDLNSLNLKLPIYKVRGNWDFYSQEESSKLVEIEGVKIYITHGHNENVKSGLKNLENIALLLKPNIICYGHTHIQNLIEKDGTTYLNSGLCEKGEYAIINVESFRYSLILKNLYRNVW